MSNNTITHSHQIINTQVDSAKLFPDEDKARAAFIALAREKLEGSLIEEHISLIGKKAPCPYCKSQKRDKGKKKLHSYGEKFYCFSCRVSGKALDLLALFENPTLEDYNGNKTPCDNSKERAAEKVLNVTFSSFIGQERKPKTKAQIKKERGERDRLKREREERDRLEEAERARKAAKTLETCKAIWAKSKPNKEKIIHWLVDKRYFPQALAEKAYTASKEILRYSYYEGKEQVIALEPNESLQIITFNGNLKKDEPDKILFGPTHFLPIETDSERLVIVESLACALALSSIGISAITIFSTSNTKKMLPKIMERYSSKDVFLWLDSGEKEKELSSEACRENQGLRQVLLANKEKGFDVNDLLRENPSNFKKAVEGALNEAEKIFRGKYGNDNDKCLLEAFEETKNSKEKFWLVTSPTGSGKSTSSINLALERLKQGESTVLVASQNGDLKSLVSDMSEDYRISEDLRKRIFPVNSENKANIEKVKELDSFVMVTHHTFFTRKAHSVFHYSALLVLEEKKALVIIDEFKTYAQAQAISIPLGGRYSILENTSSKSDYFQKREKCPGFSQGWDCKNCHLSKKTYIQSDGFKLSWIKPYFDKITPKAYGACRPIKIKKGEEIQVKTNFFYSVESDNSNHLDKRKYLAKLDNESNDKSKTHDAREIIQDMINSSYTSEIFKRYPIEKKSFRPIKNPSGKIDGERKKEVNFPAYTCEHENLNVWDLSALRYIAKHSEKVIMLASDVTEAEKDFSKAACYGKLEFRQITTSLQKIQNLMVIFHDKELKLIKKGKDFLLSGIVETLEEDEKMLIFCPTEAKAKQTFLSFPRSSGLPVGLITREYDIEEPRKRGGEGITKTWVTHSLGSQGKAVNRPKDMVTVIDAFSVKPPTALRRKKGIEPSEEEIKSAMIEEVTEVVKQNQGRMLRINKENPNKPKLLIIHNCQEFFDRESVIEKLRMCTEKGALKIRYAKSSEEVKKISLGHMNPQKEKEDLASKRKEERQRIKREIGEKITGLVLSGITNRREIERKLNLKRYMVPGKKRKVALTKSDIIEIKQMIRF